MTPTLERIPRGSPRVPEAVAVTARAFWRDPLFSFFARDLLGEYRTHPGFQRSALQGALAAGEVWAATDPEGAILGVAAWLPPDPPGSKAWRTAREMLTLLPVFARIPHRRRAWRLLWECEARQPEFPHFYLALLGVDPAAQGQGVGGALVGPLCTQADAAGAPCYLETQKTANVAWYGRFGFVETDRIELPGTPTVWCLTRDPR